MTLALQELSKTYETRTSEDVTALQEVTLAVEPGELVTIVGPSGSGKTTLLRIVAGLETPDSGRVSIGGRDVTDVAPGERDVAMVFQEYALFPHLSVRDNIAFGLEARRVPRAQVRERVQTAAAALGLVDALARRPAQLSGGERQRVALARAMVRSPQLFLMDEPLSNLDAELRTTTRAEIRALQRQLGTTTIYVTHDQTEALSLGDRVAVLRNGRVEQVGAPDELYRRPANSWVARFIGTPAMNLFPSSLAGARDDATWGVRPEDISLVGRGEGLVPVTVDVVEPTGADAVVHLRAGAQRMLARVAAGSRPSVGDELDAAWRDDARLRFDAGDGRLLNEGHTG